MKAFITSHSVIVGFALISSLSSAEDRINDSPSLSFYSASEQKIKNGRFIDTLECPKVGYINSTPDLVITQLQAIKSYQAQRAVKTTDVKGKTIDFTLKKFPALKITLQPKDAQKLIRLTDQGSLILVMLDDTPLFTILFVYKLTEPELDLVASTEKFPINKVESALMKMVDRHESK